METLKFVQGLVETLPYRCFVAGEFGEGVDLICILYKGSAKSRGLSLLLDLLHLLGLREDFLMLLFVRYDVQRVTYLVEQIRLVSAGLLLGPFG